MFVVQVKPSAEWATRKSQILKAGKWSRIITQTSLVDAQREVAYLMHEFDLASENLKKQSVTFQILSKGRTVWNANKQYNV